MFTHLVLFRFPDDATAEEAVAKMRSMPAQISEIESLSTGRNLVESDRAFDVGLVITFADRAAFDRYSAHPFHVPIAAWIHDHMTGSAAADFVAEA